VGADMTRKFLRMGMTSAKRYARHSGGKKYDDQGKEKHQANLKNGCKRKILKKQGKKLAMEKLLGINQAKK